MDEKDLIQQWNTLRKNFVYSQIVPTLLFLLLIQQASNGKLTDLPDQIRYFIVGIVGISGILSFINQYSSIREAFSLTKDLKKIKKKTDLAIKVSNSQPLLNLTALAITSFSLISFGLLVLVLFA
jgi:hypothetical protein